MEPGVTGAPPVSLVLDDVGIYHDSSAPSRLELLLNSIDLNVQNADRARSALAALRAARLSKYTPPVRRRDVGTGHVLVVDQTAGDASIAGAGADRGTFGRMLAAARSENPGARIIVKSHPDVQLGRKRGHVLASDLKNDEVLFSDAANPWDLIEGARAVYTVSSQLGYEAVLAGRPVRCFGMGFYAGWGLTEDEHSAPRRARKLSVDELFTACHLNYPVYYDPWRDRLCDFETALSVISHQVEAATPTDDAEQDVFGGVRLWKRRNVAAFRPHRRHAPVFLDQPDAALAAAREAPGRNVWLWASKSDPLAAEEAGQAPTGYVEDGFLRSVGLGAALTEASSLVFDRQGIYFDPRRPSDLEDLITAAAAGAADVARAAELRASIVQAGVSKYNVGDARACSPPDSRSLLLVPGQVEDDASILRGCGDVRTNFALLEAARDARPDAWIVYKPHPDVEAGLRAGRIDPETALGLANEVAEHAAPAALLDAAHEVWTMTSLMGFEALLRGVSVTCLGTPFFAGWGLTNDLGPSCPRRTARPTLDQLVWAALVAYPRYRDPVSGLPCPPEVIVERLASGQPGRRATLLSKLQAVFAEQSWLWRH